MIDCNKCIVQNCIFNSTTPKKSCQWYEEKKAEKNSFFNFDKVIEIECNKARADERERIENIFSDWLENYCKDCSLCDGCCRLEELLTLKELLRGGENV